MDKNLKPIVGVSACLLGENVRYDGANKNQPLIQKCLQPHLKLQAVCPEVRAGLGIPRPTIQLHEKNKSVRAIFNQGQEDISDKLTKVAVEFLNDNYALPLCGFIFKSRSPSCGLQSTPVVDSTNGLQSGLFAHHIKRDGGNLLLVEETQLVNEETLYCFLTACYLMFHHRYSGNIDLQLLSLLKLTERSVMDTNIVNYWIDILLQKNIHESRNDKAALSERLCGYWVALETD